MPEGLAQALLTEGLGLVLLFKLIAGVSYGFAGFGAALIFIPLASMILPPQMAVAAMAVSAIGSAVTVLPSAWGRAHRADVMWMLLPAFVTLVPGIWLLRVLDPTPLRWVISGFIAVTLVLLMAGWRRSLAPSRGVLAGVGAGTGLVGGMTGLSGPVVILFNLAGDDPVEVTRANTISFMTILGILMLPQLAVQGVLTMPVLWMGLLLTPVYMLGTMIGKRLFDPRHAVLYRRLGYAVIGLAVLVGLPLWD